MISDELKQVILEKSILYGLSNKLISAIVLQESGGNPYLYRFEAGWIYFKDVEVWAKKIGVTTYTEKITQAMSFGPMQIMGSNARALGFTEELVKLCSNDLGMEFGCRYLFQLSRRYTDSKDLIAAYNGGHPRRLPNGSYYNQSYVDSVLRHLSTIV